MVGVIMPNDDTRNKLGIRDTRYAGFWIRVVALLIDVIILGIILPLIVTIALGLNYTDPAFTNIFSLFSLIILHPLFESSKYQGTPGKIILGLRITNAQGRKIGYWKALGRNFAKIFSGLLLCIGYIMVAFHKRKRGLHDIFVNTYVVKK